MNHRQAGLKTADKIQNGLSMTASTLGTSCRRYPKDLPVARVSEKIDRAVRRLAHVADAFS
jgi:hypothetical protein